MNFGNAAILSLLVFVGVEILKGIIPDVSLPTGKTINGTLITALLVGIGATFLVAATVWGHTTVVGTHALDSLDGWSKLVVGIFAGAGSVGIDKGFKAVSSIGENQPPKA